MSAFNPRKRWAVWVIIAWLATVIAVWAFEVAGKRALAEPVCSTCRAPGDPCQLAAKIPDLQLADRQNETRAKALDCDQPCPLRWMKARTWADFLLIPSYSALFAVLFLLLSAPRNQGDPPAARPWAVVGFLLALTMFAADCTENFLLFRSIGLQCSTDAETLRLPETLRLLWTATATKWGAIALASALAGVLALIRKTGWVTIMAGLLGLTTGGVLATGIFYALQDPPNIEAAKAWMNRYGGMYCMFAFFTAILIHAVIVVVKPDPVYIEPAAGGTPKP